MTKMYSRWWERKKKRGSKAFVSMFLKECCHILNIQTELFLILVTIACLSQDYCFVSFYPFPSTVISIVMTSPGECHSVMLRNCCLLGNQNVRELHHTPYCPNTKQQQRHPNETSSGLFKTKEVQENHRI